MVHSIQSNPSPNQRPQMIHTRTLDPRTIQQHNIVHASYPRPNIASPLVYNPVIVHQQNMRALHSSQPNQIQVQPATIKPKVPRRKPTQTAEQKRELAAKKEVEKQTIELERKKAAKQQKRELEAKKELENQHQQEIELEKKKVLEQQQAEKEIEKRTQEIPNAQQIEIERKKAIETDQEATERYEDKWGPICPPSMDGGLLLSPSEDATHEYVQLSMICETHKVWNSWCNESCKSRKRKIGIASNTINSPVSKKRKDLHPNQQVSALPKSNAPPRVTTRPHYAWPPSTSFELSLSSMSLDEQVDMYIRSLSIPSEVFDRNREWVLWCDWFRETMVMTARVSIASNPANNSNKRKELHPDQEISTPLNSNEPHLRTTPDNLSPLDSGLSPSEDPSPNTSSPSSSPPAASEVENQTSIFARFIPEIYEIDRVKRLRTGE